MRRFAADVEFEMSCPGRGAAFFMPRRRAGTVAGSGDGTIPDQRRTAGALRRIRDTQPSRELR